MRNFIQRALSGFIFVVVLLSCIYFSPYTFAVLFAVICGIGVYEFHKISQVESDRLTACLSVIGGVLLFASTFLSAFLDCAFPFLLLYAFYVLVVLVAQLFRVQVHAVKNWASFLIGQVMIALPFATLNGVVRFDPEWQPVYLLAMFFVIWMNDSWAYVFGITMGRTKMFERVSPKKTWEGFLGGFMMSLVMGYLCWLLVPYVFPKVAVELWQWIVFGGLVSVFGTIGDLMESLIKRTYGVKDSGNLIPGHGGVLDRLDSMMLAAPVVYVFMRIVDVLGSIL